MDKTCAECGGGCCSFSERIHIMRLGVLNNLPRKFYDEEYYPESRTYSYTMKRVGGRRCIALHEGVCSVWANRPLACRTYVVDNPDCKVIQLWMSFRLGRFLLTCGLLPLFMKVFRTGYFKKGVNSGSERGF